MKQGHVAALSVFSWHLQRVTKNLACVDMYLDDAIAHDANPQRHVDTVGSLFSRLKEHNLKLALSKARIGATEFSILGYSVSGSGLRPNGDQKSA